MLNKCLLNEWMSETFYHNYPRKTLGWGWIHCGKVNTLPFFNFFNWSIIVLQCCLSFCYTATWISMKYTYILSLWSLPPRSPPTHPLGHHRAPSWAPCTTQQFPNSRPCLTFMHWRRKWQPTPVFLPGESQGWRSLVGCRLWGHRESDTTEAT